MSACAKQARINHESVMSLAAPFAYLQALPLSLQSQMGSECSSVARTIVYGYSTAPRLLLLAGGFLPAMQHVNS